MTATDAIQQNLRSVGSRARSFGRSCFHWFKRAEPAQPSALSLGNGTSKSAEVTMPMAPSLSHADAGPDFLCVGGEKSGTTWLYRQLWLHPDFWMPPRKELHYFDKLGRGKFFAKARQNDERDLRFLEGMKKLSEQTFIDLEGYGQLFAVKGSLISGDMTPAYSMLNDEIIVQILRRFPKLKVIFLARDPVERALSALSMAVRFECVSPFDVTDPIEVTRRLLHPDMMLRSHPSKIVARWRRHVSSDQFRLYFFDELETGAGELRRSAISFLGGDPEKPSARASVEDKVNAEGASPFPAQIRSHVAQFFEPELKACATELGGPASNWPARYGLSLLMFLFTIFDNILDLAVSLDWAI